MGPARASVRTEKNRFSEFLSRVQRGEEIIGASHNRPVANPVPPGPEDARPRPSRETITEDLSALPDSLSGTLAGEPLSRTVADLRKKERL